MGRQVKSMKYMMDSSKDTLSDIATTGVKVKKDILDKNEDDLRDFDRKISEVLHIKKIKYNEKSKNLIIRLTDNELLDKTGGIIQGMSGSPLIQNGKLIGAVTHVLVNDPTRGYGIFIENMLEASE